MKNVFIFLFSTVICLQGIAEQEVAGRATQIGESTPDSYELAPRDLIRFVVLNEQDTVTEQRIDGDGRIRVPYLGSVRIAGYTVRQAERGIERAYRDNEIYIDPQVTIRIAEYSVKEVSVLGEVNSPGKVRFPIEANSLDIRDVISQAGGFTNIARSRQVHVTRTENGREVEHKVDVDRMLQERRGGRESGFRVLPSDVIFVPERFF